MKLIGTLYIFLNLVAISTEPGIPWLGQARALAEICFYPIHRYRAEIIINVRLLLSTKAKY